MAKSHTTAAIVIPARLASTRLPEKLLLRETGKSLLRHTYEAACRSTLADRILIAADDQRIVDEVATFPPHNNQNCGNDGPALAVLTDPELKSGTDRIASVAGNLPDVDIIVNVQGDEPELDPAHIDLAITLLLCNSTANMSTLAAPITSDEQWHDPNCVKVVTDATGRALYFSRAPIPFVRDGIETGDGGESAAFEIAGALQHIGLYAYRREFLLEFAALPASRLEELERLEQLRALESGQTILCGTVPHACGGIDTPSDYAAFVERQRVRLAG